MDARYAKRHSQWTWLSNIKKISFFKGAVIVKFDDEKGLEDLVLDGEELQLSRE